MADVLEALRRAVDFDYAVWLGHVRSLSFPRARGLYAMGSGIGSSTRCSGWRTQRGRQPSPKELDLKEADVHSASALARTQGCVMSNPRFCAVCLYSKSIYYTSMLGPKHEYKFTSIQTICTTGFKLATLTLRFRKCSSWAVASCNCLLIDQVGTNTIRHKPGLCMEQTVYVRRAQSDV